MSTAVKPLESKVIEKIKSGELAIWLVGAIAYEDCFGNRYISNFRHYLTGKNGTLPKDFSVASEGNYEERIVSRASEMSGLLTPGNDNTPDLKIPIMMQNSFKNSSVVVLLGSTLGWTNRFPFRVITQQDEPMVTIGRDGQNIWLSAQFFDKNGNPICGIRRNKFSLSLHATADYQMTTTEHSLTVVDDQKHVIFDFAFVNSQCVRILGDFYLRNGKHILITPDNQMCGTNSFTGTIAGNCKGILYTD